MKVRNVKKKKKKKKESHKNLLGLYGWPNRSLGIQGIYL